MISFQCHPAVGHILVLSWYLFFAPLEEEKYFPEIGKIFSAECYVIGSLPPPRHSWESLEAINRIGPVLEELLAEPFLPDKYDSGSLE